MRKVLRTQSKIMAIMFLLLPALFFPQIADAETIVEAQTINKNALQTASDSL